VLLRGIGEQYGVNLIVDDQIQQTATVRLGRISVLDALQLICREHGLSLLQSGPVFRVRRPPDPPPEPPTVAVDDGRITLDLSNDDLGAVAEVLTKKTDTNVLLNEGVDGTLSGYLERVPLKSGLSTLLENNGYVLREREGIFVIDRKAQAPPGADGRERRPRSFWVDAEQGTVDLKVNDVPIGDVLREVAAQMNLNLVTYKSPTGRISATVQDMEVEEVFDLLFRSSSVTYRRKDSTYFVGARKTSSIATTELISLDHVKAQRVPKMLPGSLKKKATIKVVSEHNGLLVTGANNAIDQLRKAIKSLDQPTPLILIETLVVDFTTTDLFELGFEFGQDAERSEAARRDGYRFDEDGFEGDAEDNVLNEFLRDLIPLTSNFGIQNIGELPEDFFLKLQALSEEGKVDIRSRPQVAALSGHTASIEIGQTQYFILRKETPVRSPEGGAIVQETERFEKIEANVSLEITPWVTSSGEVTTRIRPEFSQPVGQFNSEVPPTINTRVLESTVRLKEGETIILGGLIRDEREVKKNQIPLLGDIPWIGEAFTTRSTNTEKSELVIYLTPHVFYGGENEPERWEQLRDEMGLQEPREHR
jgi:type IV pilus assembly protein PilQ